MVDQTVLTWLSAPENPAVRYLTWRDLLEPRPSVASLRKQRRQMLRWEPLQRILGLQLADGGFPDHQQVRTARPTFWALVLMERCGLDLTDEPVARAIDCLARCHAAKGPLSYTGGGSGVLPCYAGVMSRTLIGLGAIEHDVVQDSLEWLADHQRFDHRSLRAGGEATWPYRAPSNFGCWESVSCYHGVAGAFRAFAAVPRECRSPTVQMRLDESIAYLRAHRLYRKSSSEKPLFRHMTQPFLVGDYRSGLLDMLQGIADADPGLAGEAWVRESVETMQALTNEGRVPLVKNYGRALTDEALLEPVGGPSRFLTYQWLRVRRMLGAGAAGPTMGT
jgi:hypothetical protein